MKEPKTFLKPKGLTHFIRDPSLIVEDTHRGMRRVTIHPGAYYTCYTEHK